MFGITGGMNVFYVQGVTDMRCGYHRLSEIVKTELHRDPFNGDAYIFMSKDRRKVKLVRYENDGYYLYEKSFRNGFKFMRPVIEDEMTYWKIEWKYLVMLLECPVRVELRMPQKLVINN